MTFITWVFLLAVNKGFDGESRFSKTANCGNALAAGESDELEWAEGSGGVSLLINSFPGCSSKGKGM